MQIDFSKASFKDFENIPDMNAWDRARYFHDFLNYLKKEGRLNYRLLSESACDTEMDIRIQDNARAQKMISFVSNDYLGYSQHEKVKAAAIEGILNFGTGSGASPAIGGHFKYHADLEEKIASFFHRDSAILYTTGYTANSATLMCLLKKEDIAILDMAVHASVYEGCQLTNVKSFLHNNLEALERILKDSRDKYRTRMVVIDGVYSQDGDLAPLEKISELTRHYGAFLFVDDAHGTGVIGNTGRGLIEKCNLFEQVDIISGTFSKTFGSIGGYVVANPELISFLKYQSRQHLFSVTATPAAAGIMKAIDLLDEEPIWMEKLWENITHLKSGLLSLGFDLGTTESAILPVKIGDPVKTAKAGRILQRAGIYANPIMYPAVSRKDARIRLSVIATHTRSQIDKALNAFQDVYTKLNI